MNIMHTAYLTASTVWLLLVFEWVVEFCLLVLNFRLEVSWLMKSNHHFQIRNSPMLFSSDLLEGSFMIECRKQIKGA